MNKQLHDRMDQAINKLAKWRSVFAGWQLGTRSKEDAESQAVRDHRELTILLRAEMSAILTLMIEKGIVTHDEWWTALTDEAVKLDVDYERKFPGFTSTDMGMSMDIVQAKETMKGWRP